MEKDFSNKKKIKQMINLIAQGSGDSSKIPMIRAQLKEMFDSMR